MNRRRIWASLLFGLVAMLSVIVEVAASEVILQINCDPPKGPSSEYGWHVDILGKALQSPKDGVMGGVDSFTNTYPSFFILNDNPKTLWVRFGSTVPKGMTRERIEELSPTKLFKATIVQRNEYHLTAIDASLGEVWMYTFFPSLEFAFFTRHKVRRNLTDKRIQAAGAILNSKCRFIRQ